MEKMLKKRALYNQPQLCENSILVKNGLAVSQCGDRLRLVSLFFQLKYTDWMKNPRTMQTSLGWITKNFKYDFVQLCRISLQILLRVLQSNINISHQKLQKTATTLYGQIFLNEINMSTLLTN